MLPLPTLKRFERDEATVSPLAKRRRDGDDLCESDFLDAFAQNNGPLRILSEFISRLDCSRLTLAHTSFVKMKCLNAPPLSRKVLHIQDRWPVEPFSHAVVYVPAQFPYRAQIDVPYDLESLSVTLSSMIPSLAINGVRRKIRIKRLTLDWERLEIFFSFNELIDVDTLCVRGPAFYKSSVFDSIRARRIVVMNPLLVYVPQMCSIKTAHQVTVIDNHNRVVCTDTNKPVPYIWLDNVDTRTIQILRETTGSYKTSLLALKPSKSSQDPDQDRLRPAEELESVLKANVWAWARWLQGRSFHSLRTLTFSTAVVDAKFITESHFPSLTCFQGNIQGTLFIWEALDNVAVRIESLGDVAFLPSRTGRPYFMKHVGIHTERSVESSQLLKDVSNVAMIYKLELQINAKCVLPVLPPVRTLFLRQAEALPDGDWALSVHNLICEHRLDVDLRKFSNLKYFELFNCERVALHEGFFLRAMMNPPASLHTLVLRSKHMQDRLIALPFQLRRVFLDNVQVECTWLKECQVTELRVKVNHESTCDTNDWHYAELPPTTMPFFENYPNWELPYSSV